MDRSPGGAGDLELPPGRELRPGIGMYPTAWSESWDGRRGQPDDPRYRLVALASWTVWLVFLAYQIGDLLGAKLHGVRAVLAATGLVVFVALYVALMWPLARRADPSAAGERRRLVLLGVFAAVAIGLAYGIGKSWVGAFIYLGVACGATLPPRRAVPALVVASVLAFGAAWAAHAGASGMAFYPFMTLMIGLVVLGWIRAMSLIDELREAREEVARLAVNGERLRFARDLHDLLGHTLSLIVLKSELARRLLDRDPQAALREVQEIELVARQSLVEVRQAVSGYRSQGLRDEMDDAAAALSAAGIDPA